MEEKRSGKRRGKEMLGDLESGSLSSSNPRVVALALDTVGVIYEEYDTLPACAGT